MIYGGEEITLSKGETVKDILNCIDDDKNYFHILQLPRCGDNRIKIGKSKKIHKRFSEYANLFYGSVVYVLRLVVFPNKNIGDNAKRPAEIFESMMKSKLKKSSDGSTRRTFRISYWQKRRLRSFVVKAAIETQVL